MLLKYIYFKMTTCITVAALWKQLTTWSGHRGRTDSVWSRGHGWVPRSHSCMVLGRQPFSLGHIAPFMPKTLNHWSEAPSSSLQQNGPGQHGFQQFSVWQHLSWKPSFACCLLFRMYVIGLHPAGHAWNTSPGRGTEGGHPDRMPGSPQLAPLDEAPLLLSLLRIK